MKLWKCDICNYTMHEPLEVHGVTLFTPMESDETSCTPYGVTLMHESKSYEICEACATKLESILKGERVK